MARPRVPDPCPACCRELSAALGSKKKAAEELGVSRQKLDRTLAEYGSDSGHNCGQSGMQSAAPQVDVIEQAEQAAQAASQRADADAKSERVAREREMADDALSEHSVRSARAMAFLTLKKALTSENESIRVRAAGDLIRITGGDFSEPEQLDADADEYLDGMVEAVNERKAGRSAH